MSAEVMHLNLLNPHERKSSSPIRARVLLPVIAGIAFAYVLGWAILMGLQVMYVSSRSNSVKAQIDQLSSEHALATAIKAKYNNLLAESEQFASYGRGRVERGELLKELSYAIPEGITLISLSIPPPPEQQLRPPPGSKDPPKQGPDEKFEKVELRIVGIANTEQDIFDLMNGLKGDHFTNTVTIVERPANREDESPKVLAFRQEAATAEHPQEGLFFDIVYTLKPREFAK